MTKKNGVIWLAFGAGLGSLLMYFLDPDRGRRRRHLFQDQVHHISQVGLHSVQKPLRRFKHKLKGFMAELRRPGGEVDDDQLNGRVRSEFGHRMRDARAVESHVNRGIVTLEGKIDPLEAPRLVACVQKIPGVKGVRDLLNAKNLH